MVSLSTTRQQSSATPFQLPSRIQDHSDSENRFIDIGISHRMELLVVSYAERKDKIRIISARRATRAERKNYEEEK